MSQYLSISNPIHSLSVPSQITALLASYTGMLQLFVMVDRVVQHSCIQNPFSSSLLHPLDMDTMLEVHVFFGINRFNLAKGLKVHQVHNSDTPSFFTEIGGGVGSIL